MSYEQIGEYLQVCLMERAKGKKTDRWEVFSVRGSFLGEIKWYGAWRQYSIYPAPSTIFNKGCMIDLCKFLDRIHKEKKEEQDHKPSPHQPSKHRPPAPRSEREFLLEDPDPPFLGGSIYDEE